MSSEPKEIQGAHTKRLLQNEKAHIRLILINDINDEQMFLFIKCTQQVLDEMATKKETIDFYDERITILHEGMGKPTEEDFRYMKEEHDFVPDKPKGMGR